MLFKARISDVKARCRVRTTYSKLPSATTGYSLPNCVFIRESCMRAPMRRERARCQGRGPTGGDTQAIAIGGLVSENTRVLARAGADVTR